MPQPKGGEDGPQAPPVAAIVAATLLAFAGLAIGLVLGGDGEPERITVVDTVTVAATETVTQTRTVTETVTEPADELTATETDDESGDDCSADYLGACVPIDAPDVSCADLADEDFDSIGEDPYGLDPDGDGIACET